MNVQVIRKAKQEYEKYNCKIPKQFNLNRDKKGNWSCAFEDEEGRITDNMLLWLSGKIVLEIWFSEDVDLTEFERWDDELHGD